MTGEFQASANRICHVLPGIKIFAFWALSTTVVCSSDSVNYQTSLHTFVKREVIINELIIQCPRILLRTRKKSNLFRKLFKTQFFFACSSCETNLPLKSTSMIEDNGKLRLVSSLKIH